MSTVAAKKTSKTTAKKSTPAPVEAPTAPAAPKANASARRLEAVRADIAWTRTWILTRLADSVGALANDNPDMEPTAETIAEARTQARVQILDVLAALDRVGQAVDALGVSHG